MLGALYCDIHAFGLSGLDKALAKAEDCAQRAMVPDQNCQYTHYASAYVGALTRDHPRIAAAFDNILRLNPNAAFMVGAASFWLGMTGRFDLALPHFERSLELLLAANEPRSTRDSREKKPDHRYRFQHESFLSPSSFRPGARPVLPKTIHG